MHAHRYRHALAAIVLAATGIALPAAARPVVTYLPPQTPAQIEARLEKAVQTLGDLTAYIDSVDDDDTIVLNRVVPPHSACGTSQPVTTLRKPLDKERLAAVERAIEVVNQNLSNHQQTKFRYKQSVC